MERSLTKYTNFRFNSLRKYMLPKYFEYFDILFQFNSATRKCKKKTTKQTMS